METLPPDARRAVTRERLRLLSWGYYISGGLGILTVSFLLIHLAFLIAVSSLPESAWAGPEECGTPALADTHAEDEISRTSDEVPVGVFRILAGALGLIILLGWIMGGLTIFAGRCLARRRNRLFVMVMAGWNCLWIPYGTLLGVLTFLTLGQRDVRDAFGD